MFEQKKENKNLEEGYEYWIDKHIFSLANIFCLFYATFHKQQILWY